MKKQTRLMHSVPKVRWKMRMAGLIMASLSCEVFSAAMTDTSTGHTSQTLSGNMTITQQMGKLSGSNLFHSFTYFDIGVGESANFTTSTAGINNVITRVTGDSSWNGNTINGVFVPGSYIAGPLSLTPCGGCGAPNFFFINPLGVTFAAGASINVPGAFHVSTANNIKFQDGVYSADLAQTSTFSVASPESFGFLGTTLGAITLKGAATISANTLQSIDMVAGDINISSGVVRTYGGDIRMLALGQQAQNVALTGTLPAASGNMAISNGSYIVSYSSGSVNGGSVKVGAGSLTIDGGTSGRDTGIYSLDLAGNTGSSGSLDVTVANGLSLFNGGGVTSTTYDSGNAGSINIKAGSISIDGKLSNVATGIASFAQTGSTGSAGNVNVTSSGTLAMSSGFITADTFTAGNAGTVTVSAGGTSLMNDAYIASNSRAGSTGNAGAVTVTAAGNLSLVSGSTISSSTWSSGNAGTVNITAGNINIDRNNLATTGIFSSTESGIGNAGNINILSSGNISIVDGGAIASATHTAGRAGTVNINAASVNIDRQSSAYFTGISSDAVAGTGSAGNLDISTTGLFSIANGGLVRSSTYASGNAGSITVNAGSIAINGYGRLTGFACSSESGTGIAGSLNITSAGRFDITRGGVVSATTWTSGDAGSVIVKANSLYIDGDGTVFTGINSSAGAGSTGNAGSIDILTTGVASIHAGQITSTTNSSGNAGSVTVNAGSIFMEGLGTGTGAATSGAEISSDAIGNGNAGKVKVTVTGNISINKMASITSDTSLAGHAGTVQVDAGSIDIKGDNYWSSGIFSTARTGSTGNAGSVSVTTLGNLSLSGSGQISSVTHGTGNGGTINVNSLGQISISGTNSGISSSTYASGTAGTVTVDANTLLVDAGIISADAFTGSSGQTGSVVVNASDSITLSNGGSLSITNDATVASPSLLTPTSILVSAANVTLKSAKITAASTGNVSASNINIVATNELFIDPSIISTSANLGNGGAITIQAGNAVNLIDSQITTSVLGLTGNGGNISIAADKLIMNSGFIQANTAATNALGGTIDINANLLIPSSNTLFVGGSNPYTYQRGINVIQAAAPTGVSGTIQVTTPVLDALGNLNGLVSPEIDTGGLGRSPCQATAGSSLALSGRGGLPPSGRGLLRAEPHTSSMGNVSNSLPFGAGEMRLALSSWGCS